MLAQIFVNGLLLGALYSAIALGFSLVWGVLNIINILHGSLIVLGAYLAFFLNAWFGISPFAAAPVAAMVLFIPAFLLQLGVINRVLAKPVLITLTLTFGLNLMLNNAMLTVFRADYRKVVLDPPLGVLDIAGLAVPVDRLAAGAGGICLVALVWLLTRTTQIGRAIVAVRMDRDAAALMGIPVATVYALTFALAAAVAGAAGALLSAIFPISPVASAGYLGKAFVICVLGGLGSIPGVVAGGFGLGIIESYGALWLGPEHAGTVAFVLLLLLLLFRPNGLFGRKGFE